MGQKAARVGDAVSHGGTITTGSTDVKINGKQAGIVTTSTISCSLHGSGTLAKGSSTVKINGMEAGRFGDTCSCSATVSAGSDNVKIGGGTAGPGASRPDVPDWANAPINAARVADILPSGPAGITALFMALTRQATTPPPQAQQSFPSAADAADRNAAARRLVRAGGSGTQADVDAVGGELERMPLPALRAMEANGTRVVAARGGVGDYATDLMNAQPRGHPAGASWATVPGAYRPDTNEVIIATTGDGTPNGRRVPPTGNGHGSANLVVHEAAHSIDRFAPVGRRSSSAAFIRARDADAGVLSNYELQPGAAGWSESYAESAARYYGGSYGPTTTPSLDAWWGANPLGAR